MSPEAVCLGEILHVVPSGCSGGTWVENWPACHQLKSGTEPVTQESRGHRPRLQLQRQ